MKEGWKVLESKHFVIPSLPPSVNSIYQIIFSQRRVEMKPDVRLWKTNAKELIPKLTPLSDSCFFKVDCLFYLSFFYKNGRLRKIDMPNLLKVLIDAIAEKNGFDDSLVKFGSWESYHCEEREWVEVNVSQITQERKMSDLQEDISTKK